MSEQQAALQEEINRKMEMVDRLNNAALTATLARYSDDPDEVQRAVEQLVALWPS